MTWLFWHLSAWDALAWLWKWSMLITGGVLALGLCVILLGVWMRAGLTCAGCGQYNRQHNEDGTCP